MEKTADEIQRILGEKFACYQQIHLVLKAEKKAIKDIDLSMIWETTKAKKGLVGKIMGLRNELVLVCQNHSPGLAIGTENDSFSLQSLVNALPLPTGKGKDDIRALKQSIDKEKDVVDRLTKLNQLRVKKNLSVVDDIMAVIANNASQAQYTGRGMVTRNRKDNCLFKIAG